MEEARTPPAPADPLSDRPVLESWRSESRSAVMPLAPHRRALRNDLDLIQSHHLLAIPEP